MTISEFYSLYSTEAKCRTHLKLMREKQGIVCKKCENVKHYWLVNKEQWQCSSCGFRTTLRSGTLFEASKLKLKIWYEALYLVCNTKKGISACELQRQLGLKRNEPSWYMMQKIRKAMAHINEQQQISNEIEMDDAFITTIQNNRKEALQIIRENKKDRGLTRQKVLVMLESISPTKEKGKIGRVRMLIAKPVADFVWRIDGLPEQQRDVSVKNYRNAKIIQAHRYDPVVNSTNKAFKIPPLIKTALGNSRRVIYGIYHHVSTKFAQLYLDEFCFKFNFRHNDTKWIQVFRQALNFSW